MGQRGIWDDGDPLKKVERERERERERQQYQIIREREREECEKEEGIVGQSGMWGP